MFVHNQIKETVMYHKLMSVVDGSGLWQGVRRNTHGFLLSPDVLRISPDQKKELEKLGFALFECLKGLSHMAAIVYADPSCNYNPAWPIVRRVFSTGVPKAYRDIQGIFPKEIPRLLKVDLMVDRNGSFRIAEIDGHNKHGVGYSTLGLRFRQELFPDSMGLPGVAALLAAEVQRRGESKLSLFYADQERFYIPEFEVAKQELEKNGVECRLVGEMEVKAKDLETGVFLDLPFLFHKKELYDAIIPAYLRRSVEFIIPPKPFLGAKGVLALLRNDGADPDLESILRTFIRKRSLDLVRSYIPETRLVGIRGAGTEVVKACVAKKPHVLKESISSGMKGTVFSGTDDFESALSKASKAELNWILQEEVANIPRRFSWFQNGSDGPPTLNTSDDWFMRVTTHYVNHQLADVIVTARRDKSVHGAPDCLQIGTIVE